MNVKQYLGLVAASAALVGALAATATAQSSPVAGDAASAAPAAVAAVTGQDTYEHLCAACHMPDALGAIAHLKAHRLAREAKIAAVMQANPNGDPDQWLPLAYDDVNPRLWPVAARGFSR